MIFFKRVCFIFFSSKNINENYNNIEQYCEGTFTSKPYETCRSYKTKVKKPFSAMLGKIFHYSVILYWTILYYNSVQ